MWGKSEEQLIRSQTVFVLRNAVPSQSYHSLAIFDFQLHSMFYKMYLILRVFSNRKNVFHQVHYSHSFTLQHIHVWRVVRAVRVSRAGHRAATPPLTRACGGTLRRGAHGSALPRAVQRCPGHRTTSVGSGRLSEGFDVSQIIKLIRQFIVQSAKNGPNHRP